MDSLLRFNGNNKREKRNRKKKKKVDLEILCPEHKGLNDRSLTIVRCKPQCVMWEGKVIYTSSSQLSFCLYVVIRKTSNLTGSVVTNSNRSDGLKSLIEVSV